MASNEDDCIENVIQRIQNKISPGEDQRERSSQFPRQPSESSRDAKEPLLKGLQQKISELTRKNEETNHYILQMGREKTCESYMETVKNDNVLLFQANQELRLIVKELMIKINDLENARKRNKDPKNSLANENSNSEFLKQVNMHKEILQNENVKSQTTLLENQVNDLQRQVKQLEGINSSLQIEVEKHPEIMKTVENYKNALQEAKLDTEKIRTRLVSEEKGRIDLNNIIANLRELDRKKEEDVRRLQEREMSLQSRIISLESQQKALSDQLASSRSENQTLQNSYFSKQQDLNKYQDLAREKDYLSGQVRGLASEKSILESRMSSLEIQLKGQSDSFRAEINSLNRAKTDLQNNENQLKQKISNLETELKTTKESLEKERNKVYVQNQTVSQPPITSNAKEQYTKIISGRYESPGPQSRKESRDDSQTPNKRYVYTIDQIHNSSSARNLQPSLIIQPTGSRQPSPSPIISNGQNINRSQQNIFENNSFSISKTITEAEKNSHTTQPQIGSFRNYRHEASPQIDLNAILNENNSLRIRIKSLEQQVEEHIAEIERLNKKILAHSQESARNRSRTPENRNFDIHSNDKVVDFQSTLNTVISKKEYEVHTVKGNSNYLIAEIETLQRENKRLRNQIKDITEHNHNNVEEIKRLTNEMNKLHNQIFSLQTSH
jgi:chromosome segregation ATPase